MQFEPEVALAWVSRLAAVGALMGFLEMMWAVAPEVFRPWSIAKHWVLGDTWIARGLCGRAIDFAMEPANCLVLGAAGCLSSLVMIFGDYHSGYMPLDCAFCALVSIIRTFRCAPAYENCDGFLTAILLLVMTGLEMRSRFVTSACLLFIAAQSCMAYLVSGLVKLRSSFWLTGLAMRRIMWSRCYGAASIAKLLDRHPLAARLGAVGVVAFECLMPLSPVFPPGAMAGMLVLGIVFHFVVASVMGLNGFLPVFASTYPAIVWLNGVIWRS